MAGHNRFLTETREWKAVAAETPCVFISHRRVDVDAAQAIADFLLRDVGVDIYFDLYDLAALDAVRTSDDAKITDFIEKGLERSTHLLGVLSRRTSGSWWVPFEIGAARGLKRQLAHTVLDDVQDLPGYLARSQLIIDRWELLRWARTMRSPLIWETKSAAQTPGAIEIPRLPAVRHARPGFHQMS